MQCITKQEEGKVHNPGCDIYTLENIVSLYRLTVCVVSHSFTITQAVRKASLTQVSPVWKSNNGQVQV